MLNSKDFGLPQNRQRVYIVGNLRGTYRPEVFPIRESRAEDTVWDTLEPVAKVRDGNSRGYAIAKLGDGIDVAFPNYPGRSGRVAKGLSHTLTTKTHVYTTTKDGHLRGLMPVEKERLQGFPDGWTEYGINAKGERVAVSETQRCKCLGNAVSSTTIKAIIQRF